MANSLACIIWGGGIRFTLSFAGKTVGILVALDTEICRKSIPGFDGRRLKHVGSLLTLSFGRCQSETSWCWIIVFHSARSQPPKATSSNDDRDRLKGRHAHSVFVGGSDEAARIRISLESCGQGREVYLEHYVLAASTFFSGSGGMEHMR